MPEIDPDLYSILTLVLLLIIALALLGIASALSQIKKTLGTLGDRLATQQTQSAAAERPVDSTSSVGGSAGTSAAPAGGAAMYGGYTPPQDAGVGATSPAVGVEPAEGAAAYGAAQSTAAPAAAQTAEPAAASQPEPQEQPFERDGRWWFRRGAELLVYDESTGQWVAAPEEASGASAGGAGATASAAEGGFWKCPACGAVNGSTATTCRMCFTARP
ncbi:MAG TPA: Ran-binding zinc finger domain-containing protein [Actinomycetota bacterium]|nr:Ran-binding zinc finger domain-containing protein [Actinomycetota bacterium]